MVYTIQRVVLSSLELRDSDVPGPKLEQCNIRSQSLTLPGIFKCYLDDVR